MVVLQSQTLTQKARVWLHKTTVMECHCGQKCDGRNYCSIVSLFASILVCALHSSTTPSTVTTHSETGRTGFETQFQVCNTHLCAHLTNKCLGCWHLLNKVPYVYNLIVSTPSYCTNAFFHALATAVVALSYKQTTTNTAYC